MKIAIASDLHLEFGDLVFENTENADVLILSGDICVAADITQHDPHNIMGHEYRSNRYHDFFQRCAENFKHVIYILGNHEHYHSDFVGTVAHFKNVLSYLDNVHVLEKEIMVIDDVTFIGGTLWTDMNNGDELTLYHMTSMMNDFRCITNSDRLVNYKAYEQINGVDNREKPIFKTRVAKFSPEDAAQDHAQMKGYIREIVQDKKDQKFVVCGHHAPSAKSTHQQYAHDTIMNGGYVSDMDQFILDHPQIRLWTHGHTHHVFDYVIGSTQIVCNPRGYTGHEARADEWTLKYTEV